MCNQVNSLKQILLLLLVLAYKCQIVLNQNDRIEISKCTEYKKSVFETESTVSYFIHGAPEVALKSDTCNSSYSPFIVGGSRADPQEFPHSARLGNAKPRQSIIDWFCGGTLITENFVLTAAHCFYSSSGEVNIVRLGDLDFSTDNDNAAPKDFNVKNYREHPLYDHNTDYHDIGIVELSRPVQLNQYIHPACLPLTTGDEYNEYIAIGWGSQRFAARSSEHLLKVKLKHFSYTYCQNLVADAQSDKLPLGLNNSIQMCAGSSGARDTCSGDSGGPLLVYHADYLCMYSVMGVTSAGIGGCAGAGIYTRVFYYMNWIKSIVWGR